MNGFLRNVVLVLFLLNWNVAVWIWGVFCLVTDPVLRFFRDGHEDTPVETFCRTIVHS